MSFLVRKAVKNDMIRVLELIKELALFENEINEVELTVLELEKDGFGENPKFQCFVAENNNKIVVQMLAYDADGQLTEILSNTLKNNVATYLSNYRMINDYVEITSAQVLDLAFDLSVVFFL